MARGDRTGSSGVGSTAMGGSAVDATGGGSTAFGGGVQGVGTGGPPSPVGPGEHRQSRDHPPHPPERIPDERTSAGGATDGPFTPRQLFRIDEALSAADRETGLTFSVYVGELDEPTRAAAEGLLERLPHPAEAVLVAVSPGQRVLEIVTGADTVRRLPDRVCALAALSMTASFGGGDLTGGIVTGLRMLADSAAQGTRSGRGAPAERSAGDPTV